MSERKTESILQRVPAILAVTAASYGLVTGGEKPQAGHGRRGPGQDKPAHGRRHERATARG